MENLDIIILTSAVIILFTIFGIGTIKEFNRMGNEKYDENQAAGGVVKLKNFLGKILLSGEEGNKK